MKAAVRPYENRDFPGSLRLLQGSPDGNETIERLMVLLTDEGSVAMVAEDGGSLVGIAAGRAAGGTGWIGVVVADDDETQAQARRRRRGRFSPIAASSASSSWRRKGRCLERRGYATGGAPRLRARAPGCELARCGRAGSAAG